MDDDFNFDLDDDGKTTNEELDRAERIQNLENEDKKDNAQRAMAWFALFGMLLYPFAVVLSSLLGLEKAADILGSMAPTYFVAVAGIVAAFYGFQTWKGKS